MDTDPCLLEVRGCRQAYHKEASADRVVLGSDHPADMSVERPVDFVESIPELSRSERELIIGGNAKRLLKLA